jgi:predicted ATP-grasp superfamily ATP-dependent carboligase
MMVDRTTEGGPVQDPRELFDLETARSDFGSPVLLYSLSGFVDAGSAGRLFADHLLETLDHEVVATFDVDQLLDYRGRRPAMTFSKDHWSQYADPSLILYALKDQTGQEFLLLVGPEPDWQWERFCDAVRLVVERLGVRLAVSFHGIPMAVPHTRPLGVTAHATDPTLIAGNEAWMGEVLVPGSAQALLELRLGEWGHPAVGYAVHVPHYLSQADFHDAALASLRAVSAVTGLSLPDAGLEEAAERTRADIVREVGDSEEVGRVVAALEQQYDAFLEGRTRGSLLAGEPGDLPSADELGAAFEQFLAEQTDDGPTPPR